MTGPRLYRATRLLTAGTALSRFSGLARVAAMTYAVGVAGTRLADTYNLANTTPNIVYELFLGGVFTAVFIPVLVELGAGRSGDRSSMISVSLVLLAVVSAATALVAPYVIRLYTFRVTDPVTRAAQLELATFLLRCFAPQIFFYGVSAIAQALLNVRGRFAPPAFAPALNNLVVAGVFLVYARVSAEVGLHLTTGARLALGIGTTAGVVVQALVLVPYLRSEGLRFRPRFGDPAVRRVVRLASYVAGYVAVNQVGLWVILALANRQQGGITAYQIAFMFFQLPHGLFAVSIHTALFPDLARAATGRDWDTYRERFASGIRTIAYLLLPAAIGYVVLAPSITRLLLARGIASTEDAALVASVLVAFAPGLLFFSAFQLLTRCFYAMQDTRTPTVVNAVAVAVNIAVNIPLFARFGVRGLALGLGVAYTAGTALLTWRLARRLPGGLGARLLAGPLLRIALGGALMGAAVWSVVFVVPSDIGKTAAGIGAGAILYLAFSQVARVDERQILFGLFRGAATRMDPGHSPKV